jgi:hypothetical protein
MSVINSRGVRVRPVLRSARDLWCSFSELPKSEEVATYGSKAE